MRNGKTRRLFAVRLASKRPTSKGVLTFFVEDVSRLIVPRWCAKVMEVGRQDAQQQIKRVTAK